MKIVMLKNTPGSDRNEDGVALPVKEYIKDETYELGASLTKAFLGMGVAKLEDDLDVVPPVEPQPKAEQPRPAAFRRKKKSVAGAPENKSN